MNENYVTVVGNVVAPPVERRTRNGGPFTTFRVASTPRYRSGDGRYVDGATSFYGVCAFNALAANVARSLQKGQPVIVHGRLRVTEWRDERDQPRTSVEIDASHVGPDLAYGQASFARLSRAEALGHDPLGDPDVQASLREEADGPGHEAGPGPDDDGGRGRPDEDPVPRVAADPGAGLGDPETDAYEVVPAGV
jgi:single-strand DNA-binding protein